jgi:hypothetical protein
VDSPQLRNRRSDISLRELLYDSLTRLNDCIHNDRGATTQPKRSFKRRASLTTLDVLPMTVPAESGLAFVVLTPALMFDALLNVSLILCLTSVGLALRVHVPNSSSPRHVAVELIGTAPHHTAPHRTAPHASFSPWTLSMRKALRERPRLTLRRTLRSQYVISSLRSAGPFSDERARR